MRAHQEAAARFDCYFRSFPDKDVAFYLVLARRDNVVNLAVVSSPDLRKAYGAALPRKGDCSLKGLANDFIKIGERQWKAGINRGEENRDYASYEDNAIQDALPRRGTIPKHNQLWTE